MHTTLLRSQKNQIFLAIKETGLEPGEFEWGTTPTRWRTEENMAAMLHPKVDIISHKVTGFYFAFDVYNDKANPRFSPSPELAVEHDAGTKLDWGAVLRAVRTWLAIVQREHLEPDFWEAYSGGNLLAANSLSDDENLPFTPTELLRVRSAIKEIGEHLKSRGSGSQAEAQLIDARLKHLEDAAGRLGRKDWITFAMGTLVNIVVGVALAPDAARELLRVAGSLLGWIASGVPVLPLP